MSNFEQFGSMRTLDLKPLKDGSLVRVFERDDEYTGLTAIQLRAESASGSSQLFPARISEDMGRKVYRVLKSIRQDDTYRSVIDKFDAEEDANKS